jgi:hypothetical protein
VVQKFMSFGHRILRAWASLLVAGLIVGMGCQERPARPLPVPPLSMRMGYFFGTPLSGPRPGSVDDVKPAEALSVSVTLVALERAPGRLFDPLNSRARLISATRAGRPVLPSSQLMRGVQVLPLDSPASLAGKLDGASVGRFITVGSMSGALPVGVTADFRILDLQQVSDPITAVQTQRRLQVQVDRQTDGTLQAALVLQDFPPSGVSGSSLQSERALLDLPGSDRDCVALLIPFHFDDALSKATAIVIQVLPATSEPSHAAALARCKRDIDLSSATLKSTAESNSGIDVSGWPSIQAGIAALNYADRRRAALVFLAEQTQASLCQDFVLVADQETLGQLAKDIQEKVGIGPEDPKQSDTQVGWILDRTTLELLSKLLSASTNTVNGNVKMPDELSAVLTTYTGEAGRHASSMDEILHGVSSRTDLQNRLLAENLIFLEDSSPASRVRAFGWLSARGQAPVGFDPLGSPHDRRDALENGLTAATAGPGGEKR